MQQMGEDREEAHEIGAGIGGADGDFIGDLEPPIGPVGLFFRLRHQFRHDIGAEIGAGKEPAERLREAPGAAADIDDAHIGRQAEKPQHFQFDDAEDGEFSADRGSLAGLARGGEFGADSVLIGFGLVEFAR